MKPEDAAAIGVGAAVVGSLAVGLYLSTKLSSVSNTADIISSINSGKSVSVPSGDYVLPSNFSGFLLGKYGQQVSMDSQARFIYPLGYAGPVWYATDAVENVAQTKVIGGQFWEAGDYTQWFRRATGIRLLSETAAGILENAFRDMWFSDCNIGLDEEFVGGNSFINQNEFQNIAITHPQTYGVKEAFASSQNTYQDITVEMAVYSGANAIGWVLDGYRNIHINCAPQDTTGTQSTGTINSTTVGTVIIGGSIESYNFVDNSPAGETTFIP